MALIATQSIGPAGLTPAYVAVAAADTFRPGPTVFLHVKNTGGTADIVTVDDKNSVGPSGAKAYDADITVTVPITTGDRFIGPITAERFADPVTGLASVSHSFQTGVTCAVLAV